MEYEYLIGHRVKISYFNFIRKEKREKIGSVLRVTIDSFDNKEVIDIIEDNEDTNWVKPFHNNITNFNVEILDEIKIYTKFTRFEIMEI